MKRSHFRWFLALVAFGLCTNATAQIYSCRAPDGTRIFSDERCGTDARTVPGVARKKKPAAKTAPIGPIGKNPQQPPAALKSAAELDALLKQCDEGKVPACNEWTRSGGPNQLRQKEKQTQLDCEAGSLAACEERYCSDGASQQCRAQVLNAAKLAGESWYVRDGGRKSADGSTRYAVRCIWEGTRTTRDISVVCAGPAGPQRCSNAGSGPAFAQLAAAAANYCARR